MSQLPLLKKGPCLSIPKSIKGKPCRQSSIVASSPHAQAPLGLQQRDALRNLLQAAKQQQRFSALDRTLQIDLQRGLLRVQASES